MADQWAYEEWWPTFGRRDHDENLSLDTAVDSLSTLRSLCERIGLEVADLAVGLSFVAWEPGTEELICSARIYYEPDKEESHE